MSKSLSYLSRQTTSLNVFFRKNSIVYQKVYYSENANTSIDSFTESLVLEKGLKWDNFLKLSTKSPAKSFLETCNAKLEKANSMCETNNKHLNEEIIIQIINENIKLNNVPQLIFILSLCKNQNYCPSKEQLLLLAKLFTLNKNRIGVDILKHLCKVNYPLEYITQSHYDHFMAEILWTEGNYKESLNLFGIVYCNNLVLQKQVKIMLCNRFYEVISNHGEASRIITTNFVTMIANKHCDYSLMAYFWKALFESEWFSDQQLSTIFLKENNKLKYAIGWMLPLMGRQLLQEHKIETFYRLIEVLLSNNMKQHCKTQLRLLFDYKCGLGDLQSCNSIVKACSDLDLSLTERQEERFLNLLLKTQPKFYKPIEFEFKF